MKSYTKEEWQKSGLLDEMPEGRIDFLIRLFNHAINYMNENSTINNGYETLVYPVIRRIYKEVHIHFNNVDEIIEELKKEYPKIDYRTSINNLDAEADFTYEYSLAYIKKIKNKNKLKSRL